MDTALTNNYNRVESQNAIFALQRSSLSSTSRTSSANMHPTSTASDRLGELIRERALLAQLKSNVPMIWEMVETEIQCLHATRIPSRSQHALQNAPMHSHHSATRSPSNVSFTSSARGRNSPVGSVTRKCIKLPVPVEKYPDYNFVGRLLGPRGTTLKKLERDTGCKIMIRGRGSIRKDKEIEVRGKPGWQHAFNETLHVVIEAPNVIDDFDSTRILTRAKETIELLLVPMPEDRDVLKRQQLRILSLLNGTYRPSIGLQCSQVQTPYPRSAVGGGNSVHLISSGRQFGIIGSAMSIGESHTM